MIASVCPTWRYVLAAMLCVFFAASCSSPEAQPPCDDPLGCVRLAPGAPLKIGVIQSLSGKVATLGLEQVRGLELALARRGDAVAGHPVALRLEDTSCVPEGGANAALKIVSDPETVAVFGTTCSGDAATAAKIVSGAGLCMISGNNSAPFLTAIGGARAPNWQPGYLRTAPNEESAGPAAGRFAYQNLGIRVAATINDGDIYTRGLTDGFRKEFERLGGTVALSATVNKRDDDMAPVLEAVRNAQARLVFFPLFQPEGNALLAQARKTPGMDGVVLMSDGALIDESFITAMSGQAVGMYFVGPTPPPPGTALDALESGYTARYGQHPPTIYYVSAFDAANILLDAIEKSSVRGPGGSLLVRKNALRDALYATKGHPGVSATLSCNEFGDCAPPRFNILRLDDASRGVEGLKANVIDVYAPGS